MQERLIHLLEKQLAGSLTHRERWELMGLVLESELQDDLKAFLNNSWERTGEEYGLPEDKALSLFRRLTAENELSSATLSPAVEISRYRWKRWAVAASIVLTLGLGGYYFLFNAKDKPGEIVQTTPVPTDIRPPATNKASITLANGQTVYLDSVASGTLAMQDKVQLIKLSDGQIAYLPAEARSAKAGSSQGLPPYDYGGHSAKAGSSQGLPPYDYGGRGAKAGLASYNTLTNPRGSKVIDMKLADGSRVWLNAGSSIIYPIAFAGNERKVSITGEAYFEITPNAAMPFKVTNDDMEVTVLSTHFNVNAYDDEADIKVTLLEGIVSVNNKGALRRLSPGQQAQASSNGKIALNKNVDMEQVMAWKNGLFSFKDADLPAVMRQLSRWYDIEIVYAGKIPEGRFEGKIPRDLSLSQLLNGLTSTSIHFKVEGNHKIIIQPE